ncbi:hypothetical protein Daus18300_010289 [Diaporthe australafricana]|uniref:Cytochrome P450 n=1 Tax=Diaporthe australafricana TaxID=127596 RepID=A0ABR3WAQ2_9PEZI
MSILSAMLGAILLIILGTTLHSGICLYRNYLAALKIGVPIRIILIDHVNPLWLVVDRRVLSALKRLPGWLGNNSFTRYNYRGWEVPDRYFSHHELGEAYILVSSRNVWLYISDPGAVTDIARRAKEFDRETSVTAILDVFGPNISTSHGAQWQKHRRITASSFNDQSSMVAWAESITVAQDMLRCWISQPSVSTAADDLRTFSLHVMSRAGFGKSFKFQGHDEKATTGEGLLDYKDALKMILENCVLIFALGPKNLGYPWLPKKLKTLHKACASFQKYMTELYEEEKRSYDQRRTGDRTFMASLVRASQNEKITSKLDGGLRESEIYGNMFIFNFAGHDTTAHTLTYATFFLAANPAVQDWVSEEIRHVMGDRRPEDWLYSDFTSLKRCLAVMYETLRLYTPVPTSKIVGGQEPQPLTVAGKTLMLAPGTMIVPSYASLQTDPKYWGEDSLEWRPSSFIKPSASGSLDDEEFITPERGTFLSWSMGARDCVGRKFSQVEFVGVMATLFQNHRVNPVLRENEGETPDGARRLCYFCRCCTPRDRPWFGALERRKKSCRWVLEQ